MVTEFNPWIGRFAIHGRTWAWHHPWIPSLIHASVALPSMDGLGHGIIHGYRVLSMTWSDVIDNQLTRRWMDYEPRERHAVIHSPVIGSKTCCNLPSMDGLGHGLIHDYRVLSMTWSAVIDNQSTSRWMDDELRQWQAPIHSPPIGNLVHKEC